MDELEEKKEELRKLIEDNTSMWKSYGSELSAGYMFERENVLRAEITLIEQSRKQSDHNAI